jgi:hypothetical protein
VKVNFEPKIGPLVAEFLSGSTVLLLEYFAINLSGQKAPELHVNVGVAISLFALLAWLTGTFVDAVRNLLLENAWDLWTKTEIKWNYFVLGDEKKIANLERYFFSFYMLDADLAISILLAVWLGPYLTKNTIGIEIHYSRFLTIVCLAVATVFFVDAVQLRCEIKGLVDAEKKA